MNPFVGDCETLHLCWVVCTLSQTNTVIISLFARIQDPFTPVCALMSQDHLVNLQRVQGQGSPRVRLGVSPGLKVEPAAVLELTQAVPGARQPAEASPVVPWRRLKLSSRPLPP